MWHFNTFDWFFPCFTNSLATPLDGNVFWHSNISKRFHLCLTNWNNWNDDEIFYMMYDIQWAFWSNLSWKFLPNNPVSLPRCLSIKESANHKVQILLWYELQTEMQLDFLIFTWSTTLRASIKESMYFIRNSFKRGNFRLIFLVTDVPPSPSLMVRWRIFC